MSRTAAPQWTLAELLLCTPLRQARLQLYITAAVDRPSGMVGVDDVSILEEPLVRTWLPKTGERESVRCPMQTAQTTSCSFEVPPGIKDGSAKPKMCGWNFLGERLC